MTIITMGTQDEAPMIIESENGQIILSYDDAVQAIQEIATAMNETPLEVVQHLATIYLTHKKGNQNVTE